MRFTRPQVFDANSDLLIPRTHFSFDPERVGHFDEFSCTFVESDIAASEPLQNSLELIPRPPRLSMRSSLETVSDIDIDHAGAKLSVEEAKGLVTVRFGFAPLPELDESQAPELFKARAAWRRKQAEPIAEGWSQVFQILPRLTNLQYQFGVPRDKYDTQHPTSPARWSYMSGKNINQPRVIVTEAFDKTLRGTKPEEALKLTIDLSKYLLALGMASGRGTDPFSGCVIGKYDRIFSNGQNSLGQRGETFTTEDLASQETLADYRLQSGDSYEARGHNLSDISIPQWLAMVSVGALSRMTLIQQATS